MKKLTIAFDIDDTLLIPSVATESGKNEPNEEVIAAYRFFQAQGHHMILWSGSGVEWAKKWADKFGLYPDEIREKVKETTCLDSLHDERHCNSCEPVVDICFDDCTVDLAKVNVPVKRINNSISREKWNKEKR